MGVGMQANPAYSPNFPYLLLMFYEMQFAAVTGTLLIGGVVERIKIGGFAIFIFLWAILVYAPIACWMWNANGWGHAWGIIDYAGGCACEMNGGFSTLGLTLVVGRRKM